MSEHFDWIENNAVWTENHTLGGAYSARPSTWELALLVCLMWLLPCPADGRTSIRRHASVPGEHNFCLFVPVRRICALVLCDCLVGNALLAMTQILQRRYPASADNHVQISTACKQRFNCFRDRR